ncbi:hypothetical protein HY045_03870 [Candidatus Woesebacteria bacterium]|nr:hypothetical protein [Candidatus Woesebacteria bacterium]
MLITSDSGNDDKEKADNSPNHIPQVKVEVKDYSQKEELNPKKEDPPLVSFKVTNPITYIKLWWKKLMSREGVDLRIKVHPVTTVLIVLLILSLGFGLGKINFPVYLPFVSYISVTPTPSPTIDPWRETALTGLLRATPLTGKYYLETSSTEAVSLQFSSPLDLSKYVGKRILASGKYNRNSHTLVLSDVLDLEVLPQKPQLIATPTPSIIPTPSASPIETPMPKITPSPVETPTPTPSL